MTLALTGITPQDPEGERPNQHSQPMQHSINSKLLRYWKIEQGRNILNTSSNYNVWPYLEPVPKLYLKTAFMRTKCKHLIFCVIKELLLNFLRCDNATVVTSLQTDISQMYDIAPKLEWLWIRLEWLCLEWLWERLLWTCLRIFFSIHKLLFL